MSEHATTAEPVVIRIERGPNVVKDGVTHWVYASCALLAVGWWCQSCQFVETTREGMVDHCKQPGTHRVARWCPRHGFEQPEKFEKEKAT